jgi:dihydrofolate reductase
MGELTVTAFVTLDGVMQAPGGPDEDRDGGFACGGWMHPYPDEVFGGFMDSVFERAGAFLLGRRTYDIFADYWPVHDDPADPVASRLNGLPKHVASRTRDRFDWSGSRHVADVVRDVPELKRATEGELQVHGRSRADPDAARP